jgi:riboflavin biosynthesis pyrimidine reductase
MRPTIICHMGTSIDGGLHPSRFTRPAAGVPAEALRRHYEAIHDRFEAEGWIVGRVTMAEMAKGRERSVAVNAPLAREPHLGQRNGRNLAVAIDPSGRVHYGKDNVGGDHVVAVLGEQVSDAYLAELREDGCSYIFAGPKGEDLPGAMAQLGNLFGVKKLLVEGRRPDQRRLSQASPDRRVQHFDLPRCVWRGRRGEHRRLRRRRR